MIDHGSGAALSLDLTTLFIVATCVTALLGIFMLFRPIVVFADVLPLFGTMLGAGIGLFAFLGAAILSFITIAIAWVVYRPVIGITMLVLAAAAFYWLVSVGMKKKAARAAAMTPAPVTV